MKEKRKALWIVFFTVSIALMLTGCGSGGGGSSSDGDDTGSGADFMTISIDGGAATTYTETSDSSAPSAYDPYVWSSYSTSNNTIHLYTHSDFNGTTYPIILEIYIDGNTAGTYQITDGSAVYYTAPDGTVYSSHWALPVTGGTIQVDRFDSSAGGFVQGSFDVTAQVAGTVSTTVSLSGTFDVTRDD